MFLLFVAAAAASIFLFVYSDERGGNPYHTLYGVDFKGDICGRSTPVVNSKYAAWPIIPNTPQRLEVTDTIFDIKICVPSCDDTNTDTTNFPDTYLSTTLFRYCVPTGTALAAGGEQIVELLGSGRQTAARVINDLYIAWPVLAGAALVAIIFSFLYVKCMKVECCRCTLVVTVIILVIAGGFLTGWGLIRYANRIADAEPAVPNRELAARVTGWVCVGVTALLLLIILAMRKRIALALEVVGAAACAVDQMKSLIFYPLLPFLCLVGFMIYWVWQALYLFSVKDRYNLAIPAGVGYDTVAQMSGATTYAYFSWNTDFQYLFVYHFFYLLWVLQFIVYATYFTMAGAIANWFFSKPSLADPQQRQEGSEPGQLPSTPVLNSFGRTIRYHIGTIAFGALIIAIIRFIRAIVAYIQRKTRDAQNKCTRCLLCCVQCLLRCCQKCLDYISRNALAWCAIRGENFCVSAFHSFGLLLQNVGSSAAMTLVGTFLIFFGKICVAAITTGIAAMVLMYVYSDSRLSSTVMPIVVSFIIAYVVASLFMEVFETALDTMFLCFLADPAGAFAPAKFTAAMESARAEYEAKEAKARAKAQAAGGAVVQGEQQQGVEMQGYSPRTGNTASVTPYGGQ